jgi:Cu(I)/Ag(I) efflux system membrane protein CusA/SilA
VIADRASGKPYLEIDIDREAIARYGLAVQDVQDVIETALGGRAITRTVEGRERYPVRVRYQRELRDTLEDLGRILVATRSGAQVPLAELAAIRFERGPQMIRSEDTFPTAYVVFDKEPGRAEVEVVLAARAELERAATDGRLVVPPGVSWAFGGSWENQVRAQKTLAVVLPLSLFVIFLLLYLQFASVRAALLVWSGVLVAWSGGFVLLWLWGREGFLEVELFGHSLADLFQVGPLQLSVAVWVGFLALFGIATDDGVVIATYLRQSFARRRPDSVPEVREAVVAAGTRRVRPCLMTTATTILALLPVLTSRGRGSDLLVPMALPAFGGMTIEILTMLVVPTLWCWFEERGLRRASR